MSPPPDRLAEAAALLDRFLGSNSPEAVGYTLFQALTCRVIVAARLGNAERAKENLLTWGRCYNTFPSELDCLVPLMNRAIATILLSGILASVWRISPHQCDDDAGAIECAMTTGGQLAYGSLRWTQLLEQLSEAALHGDHQGRTSRPRTCH